jgi:hypothetical protein
MMKFKIGNPEYFAHIANPSWPDLFMGGLDGLVQYPSNYTLLLQI